MPVAPNGAWLAAAGYDYAQHAGSWNAAFCARAGALEEIWQNARVLSLKRDLQASEKAPMWCWWHALWGWERHRKTMKSAWAYGGASAAELEEAGALCRTLADGWDLLPVGLNMPKYIHDLRGCGRGRRDLWQPIEHLGLVFRGFATRHVVHLCLPAAYCRPRELASTPVSLWLAETFYLQEALYSLPPPTAAHVNISRPFHGKRTPYTGVAPAPECKDKDGAGGWVYIQINGRLGNILLDLVNGFVVAIQTRRQGVVMEEGMNGLPHSDATATGLLGRLVGEAVKVPEAIQLDAGARAEISRTGVECQWDGPRPLVSASTHWAPVSMGSLCGAFQSCALPLSLRRRLLRELLLPHIGGPGGCPADKREGQKDLLTIHLRGGDAVPAGTPEHAQPPCAAYGHAMAAGAFRQIRVVAEDAKNPCLRYLLERFPDHVVDVRLGGNLAEDICSILSARNLFLATSSLTAHLALVGSAERIFVLLPSRSFVPGIITFGFGAELYLSEMCSIFPRSVVGYQADTSYYYDKVPTFIGDNGLGVFEGVPAERTLNFPMDKISPRLC